MDHSRAGKVIIISPLKSSFIIRPKEKTSSEGVRAVKMGIENPAITFGVFQLCIVHIIEK